nr:MAG TPA: hypothetical protein [Caudoviricetes sp.]
MSACFNSSSFIFLYFNFRCKDITLICNCKIFYKKITKKNTYKS